MRAHAHLPRIAALATFVLVVLLITARDRAAAETITLETGDIVFQRSRSAQSEAIAAATGSPYTHVGIVLVLHRRPWVLEAEGTVKLTSMATFAERGLDGEYVVKRLRDAETRLTPAVRARIADVGGRFLGRRYDARFEWGDDRIYCSELVYKVFERAVSVRLGALVPARELALDAPAVQRLVTRRFRRRAFDPDEPVSSPGAIFSAPELETVLAR